MADLLNPTRKDAGASEIQEIPPLNCPHCGKPIIGFAAYTMALPKPDGSGALLFQLWGCPHQGCYSFLWAERIAESASKLSTPGGKNWPGMPGA